MWSEVIPIAGSAAPRLKGDEGVVVIDVLRATSTAVTALANGCRGLLPVASPKAAKVAAERLAGMGPLMGGERKGLKIQGFDLGNSPQEYSPEAIAGRLVIFCTTNGTRALMRARKGRRVYLGALLNAAAVARLLAEQGGKWLFFCAGNRGYFSWEDFLCAGFILSYLSQLTPVIRLGDGAQAAIKLAETVGEANGLPLLGSHAAYLKEMGLKDDLAFCSRQNVFDVVPTFRNGWLERTPSNVGLPVID